MTIKKMLLAGLVLFGLSACSNDNLPNSVDNSGTEYDTYLSINLESASLQTRTTGPAAEDTDGSDITNVTVYLTVDGKVKHSATSNVTGLKSDKIGVPAGSYKLYVVANPNANTPTLGTDADINSLISGVTKDNAAAGFMSGKFLMATASNTPNMVANAGSSVTITSANHIGNPVQASVKVDRVAVKIADKTAENVPVEGEIKNIKDDAGNAFFESPVAFKGYVLVNGNKQFNQVQQWENGGGNIAGVYADTPSAEYYSPFTDYATVSKDENSGEVTEITDLTATGNNVFITGNIFTIENCPPFVENDKLTAGMAQTTGVIYKAIANEGKTFYYVGGVVYTDLAKIAALNEFKGVELSKLTIPQLRAKGIKVYQDGVMYYTYFIKDENHKLNYKGTETKYYNVLRNSVYNLTVNKVTAIGDDVPGGGKVTPDNPNPPIDPDQMFLDVTVTINPWVLNNIGIEF